MSGSATLTDTASNTDTSTVLNDAASREDAAADAALAAAKEGPITQERVNKAKADLKAKVVPAPEASKKDDRAKPEAEKAKPGPKVGDKAAQEARENDVLARRALKRAKYSDEEIDGMKPDEIITHGLKFKAQQDEAARAFAASGTTQTGKPAPDVEGEGQGRTPDPKDSARQPHLEPEAGDPETEELTRVFDKLDDDQREVLSKHITADLGKAEQAVKKAQKETAKLRDEVFQMRQAWVRTDLKGEFPQIAEDENFERVADWMDKKLVKKANWPNMTRDELRADLADAAAAVFGREAINAARAKHVNDLSDDLAGSPRVGGTKASDQGSKVSREDLAAEAALKFPGDVDAARRWLDKARGI